MNEIMSAVALASELFPDWLRETARIASAWMPGPDKVRFRVDPGRAFERRAELIRYPDFGGKLFNLTIRQRYLPYEDLRFVQSGNFHQDTLGEGLWRAVNHADLLVPNEYWRTGPGYTPRKPLWAIRSDASQPGAVRVLEELAGARAQETGLPHFLSRQGRYLYCNVNAPYRGEFYSVNPDGEWSLHYHPVTYPLDGVPSSPPDLAGTHPVVLAWLRNMAEPPAVRHRAGSSPALPAVEPVGRAPLPWVARPPEEFTVPFRAKGGSLTAPVPAPVPRPRVSAVQQTRAALAAPARRPAEAARTRNTVKETPMPEPASIPTATGNGSTSTSGAGSTPADDPWEGAHAEVRLTAGAARFAKAAGLAQAGFVIGINDGDTSAGRECTVHFPGLVGNVRVPDAVLEPAPPFPAVTTSHGVIASIETAEALLIDTAARFRYQLEQQERAPDADVDTDRRQLVKALANMCGISREELMRQLDPMIEQQVAAYQNARTRHPAGTKKAPVVAAQDLGTGAIATIRSGESEVVPAAKPAPDQPARRR